MVHFDITINPLVTTSQYQCQNLDSQRRVVTWTHRSVVVYVPDDHCNYEVEITVVDAKNRRSSTKKSQIIRFEEKKYMLLTAERWSSGMVLLSVVLFLAIVAVAAGMTVCRVKDRRDFNTLKRSISPGLRTGPQLASKLMFGRYGEYLLIKFR
uniref:I-set domain-containing protein n=1 Tax=Heterorhabditis bacteriophora TaxID=37862 RepID=A0A1I7XFJ4_HETBA